MGAGLHLPQSGAHVDPQVLGQGESALGHSQHLLVAAPEVEHLPQTDQRRAFVHAIPRLPAPLEDALIERLRFVPVPQRLLRVRQRHGQGGVAAYRSRGQVVQVLAQRGGAPLLQQAWRKLAQQRGGIGLAAGRQIVA